MRSFENMGTMPLVVFGALALIELTSLIVGLYFMYGQKGVAERVFGMFCLVIGMFISIGVFLVGFLTSFDPDAVSNAFVSLLTNVVVWSSLVPFALVPAFIIFFLGTTYNAQLSAKSEISLPRRLKEKMNQPLDAKTLKKYAMGFTHSVKK